MKDENNFEVRSLWDSQARKYAVSLMKNGLPIGVYNRGVCAIWGNGSDDRFVRAVARIKGEQRNKRPLAATLRTGQLIQYIDENKISPSLHRIFLQSQELSTRIGSLCFVRVPITQKAVHQLPASLVSYNEMGDPILQNWDANGHHPSHLLIGEMLRQGILFPAVTSMNISGEAEIVDQQGGIQFCKDNKINIFLEDTKDKGIVKGSYTIFNVNKAGIQLVREGNIPGYLFSHLLETSIDTSGSKQSKYTQHEFPQSLFEGLAPSEARIAIISYLRGWSEKRIRNKLKKN